MPPELSIFSGQVTSPHSQLRVRKVSVTHSGLAISGGKGGLDWAVRHVVASIYSHSLLSQNSSVAFLVSPSHFWHFLNFFVCGDPSSPSVFFPPAPTLSSALASSFLQPHLPPGTRSFWGYPPKGGAPYEAHRA